MSNTEFYSTVLFNKISNVAKLLKHEKFEQITAFIAISSSSACKGKGKKSTRCEWKIMQKERKRCIFMLLCRCHQPQLTIQNGHIQVHFIITIALSGPFFLLRKSETKQFPDRCIHKSQGLDGTATGRFLQSRRGFYCQYDESYHGNKIYTAILKVQL